VGGVVSGPGVRCSAVRWRLPLPPDHDHCLLGGGQVRGSRAGHITGPQRTAEPYLGRRAAGEFTPSPFGVAPVAAARFVTAAGLVGPAGLLPVALVPAAAARLAGVRPGLGAGHRRGPVTGSRAARCVGRLSTRTARPAAAPAWPVWGLGHAPILPERSQAAKADTVRNGSIPLRYQHRGCSVR